MRPRAERQLTKEKAGDHLVLAAATDTPTIVTPAPAVAPIRFAAAGWSVTAPTGFVRVDN